MLSSNVIILSVTMAKQTERKINENIVEWIKQQNGKNHKKYDVKNMLQNNSESSH